MYEINTSELRLNKYKCVFCAEEVQFSGHIFCAEGVRTDPDNVKAIVDMEVPSSNEELQRFLGMVNYLGNLKATENNYAQIKEKPCRFFMGVNTFINMYMA